MADLLALPGRSAASSFRLAKLLDSLRAARPATDVVALAASYRHYVELDAPLAPELDTFIQALRAPAAGTDRSDEG